MFARNGIVIIRRLAIKSMKTLRLMLMRYIERNPVRAGMVVHLGDYPWSSYRHHAHSESGLNADWLTPHKEYLRSGCNEAERQSAYRELPAPSESVIRRRFGLPTIAAQLDTEACEVPPVTHFPRTA